MEKQVTFTVSIEKANIILQALGQMPYQQVVQLINDLQSQAQTQLQPQTESQE